MSFFIIFIELYYFHLQLSSGIKNLYLNSRIDPCKYTCYIYNLEQRKRLGYD